MSKSSFNALVEAKKQRDGSISDKVSKTTKETKAAKTPPKPKENIASTSAPETAAKQPASSVTGKRETVRRSYRVEEKHDKAIKVMSKFLGQGTEEEIVLNVFTYFFENNPEGAKAVQMVELLQQN